MPLTIPPSVNYPSPLLAVPSRLGRKPPEGRKSVPVEIIWGTMGGAEKCVNFNLQNNATLPVTQIVTLQVDNSACGADVQYIFPDTNETVSIPAYSPYVVVPVLSNLQQFFVVSPNSQTGDATRFQLLNFVPPPVAVPPTTAQLAAVDSEIPIVNGTTQLVPSTVSGTVEGCAIGATLLNAFALAYQVTFTIADGLGKNILGSGFYMPGTISNVTAPRSFALPNLNVRFEQGLILTQAGTGTPDGTLFVNLYYRTP